MFSKNSAHATLLPVRNMNRALNFYTKTLGGKLTMRAEGEMKDSWAAVRLSKADFWLVSPERQEKRRLAYSTFVVKDIEASVAELKKKGVKFQRAERMSSETKVKGAIAYERWGASAFFSDTEGNLLMLWRNGQ